MAFKREDSVGNDSTTNGGMANDNAAVDGGKSTGAEASAESNEGSEPGFWDGFDEKNTTSLAVDAAAPQDAAENLPNQPSAVDNESTTNAPNTPEGVVELTSPNLTHEEAAILNTPTNYQSNGGKKKSKKGVIAGVGAAAVAVVAGFTLAGASPEQTLLTARNNTALAFVQTMENPLAALSEEYVDLRPQSEGDFTLTLKEANIQDGGMTTAMFLGSNLSGSYNMDEEAKLLDVDLKLNVLNKDLLTAKLNLDHDFLTGGVPEIYDKFFGVDFATLGQDAQNSPLNADGSIANMDYASYVDRIFGLSEIVNGTNKATVGAYEDIKTNIQAAMGIGETLEAAEKANGVEKTGNEKVGDTDCTIYTVNYSAEDMKKILTQLTQVARKYSDTHTELLKQHLPAYESLIMAEQNITNQSFDQLLHNIEGIQFEKPVTVHYLIDGKKRIRQVNAVMNVLANGVSTEITSKVAFNGAKNLFDEIDADIEVIQDRTQMMLELDSKGDHADAGKYTDVTNIKMTINDAVQNRKEEVLVDLNTYYEAATQLLEVEAKLDGDEIRRRIGSDLTMGIKATLKSMPQEWIFDVDFEEIYCQMDGINIVLGLELGYGPALNTPSNRSDYGVNIIEPFKLNEAELTQLSQELNTAMEKFAAGLFSLFF